MKIFRFVILGLFLVSKISVSAQKIELGTLAFLNGENEINLIMDYSDAILNNINVQKYKNQKEDNWGPGWDGETRIFLFEKFVLKFNFKLGVKYKIMAGDFPNANYTATVKVLRIERNGQTTGKLTFTKKDSNDVLSIITFVSEGGKYGTFENLAGDGSQEAGSILGEFIRKNIPKTTASKKISKQ